MSNSSEDYVMEVLRRTISASFTDTDRGTSGGKPGMPDGLFDLPDGQLGALEVTRLADQSAMQLEGEVRARSGEEGRWEVPRATALWQVRLTQTSVDLNRLRSALEIALPRAEQIGATDVMFERETWRWSTELAWLRGVTRCSLISKRKPGVIIIPEQTQAFWIPDQFDGIAEWWNQHSQETHLAGKIAKLRRPEREHLHLALALHETATTPSMGYLLGMTDQMPAPKETLNTDLQIWFFPKWDVPILRWDPQAGWQRTTVPS